MATGIEVDREKKILHRKVSGVLQTDSYKELISELSSAAKVHPNFDILVDLRKTVTAVGMIDIMAVVSAWSRLGAHYCKKIAVIIPEVEERYRSAQIIRANMDAQGFHFRQFFDLDSASKWLIESEENIRTNDFEVDERDDHVDSKGTTPESVHPDYVLDTAVEGIKQEHGIIGDAPDGSSGEDDYPSVFWTWGEEI
jgi:hypothetical protein